MDAKMAWYSVGSSSTQLDAGSSSYSLLHSIYGSQASQLPFSDYDSEVSLDVTQSEHHVPPRLSPTLKRRLSRPKSSPASVIAAREQIRSRPTPAPARPGSALNRQPRPGSAARRIVHGRPASAAVGKRPTSAASTVRGGASPNRRRPKTAIGFQRTPSWSRSGSSTLLLDLEEEEELEDTVAPIIRETPPVRLTHTPEYFDFWQGKPLRERDFGIKVHKRKPWKRPKSDYGSRFFTRKNNDNDGQDGKNGGDDDGYGGLETLLEGDGDSALNSRRGSRDFGAPGDGGKGNDDSAKLNVSGEGLGSRRGSKDFGGKGSLRDRSTSSTGSRSRNRGLDKDSKGRGGLGSSHHDQSDWGDKDGAAADDDDYFKNSTELEGSDKHGTLLPTLSTKPKVNLTALDNHTDLHNTGTALDNHTDLQGTGTTLDNLTDLHNTGLHDSWNGVSNKENMDVVKSARSKGERRAMKQLQSTQRLPPLNVSEDDGFSDCGSGRALAATSWMDGGVGSGSGNTTRFELPMDMKTLEGMTPLKYLNKHCIISKRRMAHCSKVFKKLDTKKTSSLDSEGVKKGLIQAHHNCITEEQASSVIDNVGLDEDATVNLKLFAAICCFAERMLNLFFLPLARKEVIEMVDFEALDWKLRDCTIQDPLRMLFSRL